MVRVMYAFVSMLFLFGVGLSRNFGWQLFKDNSPESESVDVINSTLISTEEITLKMKY